MVLYPNKLPESERVCSGICSVRREKNLWNQQKGSYMKKRGTQEVNGSIL